jgi:hypothetical protein
MRQHPDVTCAVLYAHVIDLLGRFALNVQRPPDCAPDLEAGLTGTPGVEPFWSFTRRAGEPSPKFVDYYVACADHRRGFHHLRGAKDVHIVPAHPVIGVWTLSADTLELPPAGPLGGMDILPGAGVMPCVTVRMVLQEGRLPGDGRVVAEGTATKTVITLPAELGGHDLPLDDACPGATGTIRTEEATTFHVDLGSVDDVIREETGFILRVERYHWDGGDPDAPDNAIQREWNMRTGPEHLPRLVLPLADALTFRHVRLSVLGDAIHLQKVIVSPWGIYDVDVRNVRPDLYDIAGDLVWRDQDPIIHLSSHCDCHLAPRNISFRFDPFATGLAPGAYTLKLMATNWQHTANAEWSAVLRLEPDGASLVSEDGTVLLSLPGEAVATSPGASALAALLAILAALVAFRAGPRRPHP